MCHLGPWDHGLGCAMEMPWGVIRVTLGALVVAWGAFGLLWIEVTWGWCEAAFGVSLGALKLSCRGLGGDFWALKMSFECLGSDIGVLGTAMQVPWGQHGGPCHAGALGRHGGPWVCHWGLGAVMRLPWG